MRSVLLAALLVIGGDVIRKGGILLGERGAGVIHAHDDRRGVRR